MEELKTGQGAKEDLYEQLLPQIYSVINDETNPIANMANVVAALKQTFSYYSWVGFYLFDKTSNGLVLGPFQGKIACTRIAIGKGVCGSSYQKKETIVVSDVGQFPGHIFCDGDSKSEIVVPIFHENEIIGVLDVDSHDYNSFNDIDKKYLEQLLHHITHKIILS
jgi:GAF domain-containing protein